MLQLRGHPASIRCAAALRNMADCDRGCTPRPAEAARYRPGPSSRTRVSSADVQPHPPRARLRLRQVRARRLRPLPRRPRRRDPLDRRLGQGAARGGRAGDRGGRLHRLPGDHGRPGEDAAAAHPRRPAGGARRSRARARHGRARHPADRSAGRQPLSVRGDGGRRAPASTTASRTSTSAARR